MADIKKEHNHPTTHETFRNNEENIAAPEQIEDVEADSPEESHEEQRKSEEMQHRKHVQPRRHSATVTPLVQDPLTQKIEKILEDNVGEAYQRLSPLAKQEFKLKGEITARKISELLRSTHVKVKKIFQLILEWLKILPGINRFFLEQEAKIKTDRIIALHNRK